MRHVMAFLLACALAGTAQAQDAAAEEAPPGAEATEAAVTEEAASAEAAGEPPAEEAAAEPSEETPGETAEERQPWKLYAGLNLVQPTLYLSNAAAITALGNDEFDSSFYRLRAGLRLFDVLGFELQIGQDDEEGTAAGKFKLSGYKAAFFVPTGVLFEMIEVAGLIGYTQFDAERGNFSAELGGPAYGVNVELPIRMFDESLPDVRIGGGYVVYDATNDERVAGAHFGLRYDFQL